MRRELERIARDTRYPERLREIYAALDHDPVMIQECLARPVLAERLVRGLFEHDRAIHDAARAESGQPRVWEEWWGKAWQTLDPASVRTVAQSVPLPEPGRGGANGFPQDAPCVADDSWDNGIPDDVAPRRSHTAVWTGAEMIVWGEEDGTGNPLNSGGRYDPVRRG